MRFEHQEWTADGEVCTYLLRCSGTPDGGAHSGRPDDGSAQQEDRCGDVYEYEQVVDVHVTQPRYLARMNAAHTERLSGAASHGLRVKVARKIPGTVRNP